MLNSIIPSVWRCHGVFSHLPPRHHRSLPFLLRVGCIDVPMSTNQRSTTQATTWLLPIPVPITESSEAMAVLYGFPFSQTPPSPGPVTVQTQEYTDTCSFVTAETSHDVITIDVAATTPISPFAYGSVLALHLARTAMLCQSPMNTPRMVEVCERTRKCTGSAIGVKLGCVAGVDEEEVILVRRRGAGMLGLQAS